jgi:cobalt-precorrin 5A hydrolase
MTEARKPFALYAITKHGLDHARKLALALPGADVFVSEKLLALAADREVPNVLPMALPMGPTLEKAFLAYDCHVFIISVGAVVRMIAPLFKNKKVDPAVICVDDAARFSICVLSGHVGRGNAFTDRVAQILGAQSVITTASDALGTLTVDILGRDLGFTLDDPDHNVTLGCAAVVNEQNVALIQETGEPNFWPLEKPLPKGVRYFTSVDAVVPEAFDMLLMVSDRDLQTSHPAHYARGIVYRPKSLVLGVGCDRHTPTDLVARGVSQLMAASGLSLRCVRAIASIDKKANETALIALAEQLGVPFMTYTADELKGTAGIERPSATVEKHVGTPGVSEPAALRCAGTSTLLAPTRVYTEPGAGRSMTLAVARIPFDKRLGDAV